MQDREPKAPPKREYPPFCERVVPIALLIIGFIRGITPMGEPFSLTARSTRGTGETSP
jgi:hypothetical protein